VAAAAEAQALGAKCAEPSIKRRPEASPCGCPQHTHTLAVLHINQPLWQRYRSTRRRNEYDTPVLTGPCHRGVPGLR
jgi:hypothetical protein